ncbi:MAG: twin transmembrane helix small protein [Alphaproteobacteria bacterium]
MNSFFIFLMFLAITAVLGVLVAGILSMVKGGDFNRKYGNRLMQARVYLQGAALAMLALAFLVSQK